MHVQLYSHCLITATDCEQFNFQKMSSGTKLSDRLRTSAPAGNKNRKKQKRLPNGQFGEKIDQTKNYQNMNSRYFSQARRKLIKIKSKSAWIKCPLF